MSERVTTGIAGFDSLFEGGIPGSSMVLFVGHPGTGKTTLAAQFIWAGATRYGERGVYALLGETKEAFVRHMLQFGMDFISLESERRVRVLELPITREEGLQANLDKIMEALTSMNATRLVIDSFTAISIVLKEELDVRIMISLLYKFLQGKHCVSFVIYDLPWGIFHIAHGVDFLADGVVALQSRFGKNGELRRVMKVMKMRGTDHVKNVVPYEIDRSGMRFLTPIISRNENIIMANNLDRKSL